MTEAQRLAVETLSGDLAIKAGAGSGKTTVLSRRFAHAVATGDAETAGRLLTITFTTKAAAELAERVRRVLSEQGAADSARRIDAAWISTIHSFCGRLLRRHVLESGVDPYFAQLDEVEAQALSSEAFDSAVGHVLSEEPAAALLVEAVSFPELKRRVVGCHDNARALGLDPGLSRVEVGTESMARWMVAVSDSAERFDEVLADLKETPSVSTARAALADWRSALSRCDLGDDSGCQRLLELLSAYPITRAPNGCGEASKAVKDAKAVLSAVASAVASREQFEAFEKLVREYARRFRQLKSDRGALDFDDLQEHAMTLLLENPQVAARYRDYFSLVMVDEFQDTNGLQMRALAPLRRGNLCVVGDEQQSIYGFRYADVDIFRSVTGEMGDALIELADNFRSHEDVLRFVNEAFGQPHLFGHGFMRLTAGRRDGWVVPGLEGAPRVECLLVDNELKMKEARRAEAAWIAERVDELLCAGAQAGDIAVLLRAATSAGTYAQALEAKGVPVIVNAGAALLDTVEAREVRALLRAVAVPADDVALHAVLAGRMVAASDAALLGVRRRAGAGSLWQGLKAIGEDPDTAEVSPVDAETLKHAYQALSQLIPLQGRLPLADFVRVACERLDYDVMLHTLGADGIRAWANVLKIARLAEGYERRESADVAGFVEYLRQRGDVAADKPAPGDVGVHAVRIMTIHASKGLEFPVVFVSDLAAEKGHSAPSVLVAAAERDGGAVPVVGVKFPDGPLGKAANAAYLALAEERAEREVEEQKRCLYVACTRAQELLVVSGCCSLGTEPTAGKGMIDWIREALNGAGEGLVELGAPVRVIELFPQATDDTGRTEQVRDCGAMVAGGQELERTACPDTETEWLPHTISFSALDLYRRCPLSFHARYRQRLGRLSSEPEPALEFGSAVHAALQAALGGGLTEARIKAIARRGRLDGDQRRRLCDAVDAFMSSPLARRVLAAQRRAMEQPLSVPLGGTHLVGSIDLIAYEGQHALIVDYKTGKAPGEGSGREESYALQARCYALAALKAGACEAEVLFAFIEHPGEYKRFTFRAEESDRIAAELEALLDTIARDHAPSFAEKYDRALCGACPAAAGLCERPRGKAAD